MGKRKTSNKGKIPDKPKITPEEESYRLLFDFAHHLENLSRGAVSHATDILREFLKGVKNE